MWDLGEYQEGKIRVSTEKCRIWASTENGGIQVSTGTVGSGRVQEKGPGEYQKGGIWASTGEGSG